jgi:transposase
VKPFVKSNKNDFVDAEAIAEAVDRKNMRFVPIKTDDQLDLQAIHRVRDRLISRRTAVINQIRAFLLERGLVFAQTPAKLKAAMADVLENAEADLTPMMRNLIDMLWSEWKQIEQQVEELTDKRHLTINRQTGQLDNWPFICPGCAFTDKQQRAWEQSKSSHGIGL